MKDGTFRQMLEEALGGQEGAITALLARFEPEVRLIVRARLPHVLRRQFDSLDFVQSVWMSVFRGGGGGEPVTFETAAQFRAYLAAVAQNKVWAAYRRRTRTQKYDLSREVDLTVHRDGSNASCEVAATDPSPSAQVQASECLDQLLAGLSPVQRRVIELRCDGETFDAISAELGLHERTVRRVVAGVRSRLEAQS